MRTLRRRGPINSTGSRSARLSDPSHRLQRRHQGPAFASRRSKLGQCQGFGSIRAIAPCNTQALLTSGGLKPVGMRGKPVRLRCSARHYSDLIKAQAPFDTVVWLRGRIATGVLGR